MSFILNSYSFGVPLILDTNPSTKQCYSITRKLKTSYTGYCCKVRRDSDNTTQDIGFVNNLLDEASIVSFVGAGNGYIDTLYDQNTSVNLTNADANPLKQPTIAVAGVINKINSLPAMLFTASPHQYLKGSTASDWKFLSDGLSTNSIYLTFSRASGTTAVMGTNTVGTGGVTGMFIDMTNGDLASWVTNGVTANVLNATTGGPVTANTLFVLTNLRDISNGTAADRDSLQFDSGTIYKNNISVLTANNVNPANALELGGLGAGSGSFQGNILELLFY